MTIDVSGIQTFTDAELLVMVRHAIATVTLNQSYAINGRQYTRADLNDLRDAERDLKARIEETANGGRMTAYGSFNRQSRCRT
jgi:hypothetical protein